MITLTTEQFNQFKQFNKSNSQPDFSQIKECLKGLKALGLSIPKLNSKKVVIMDYWQQVVKASISYAVNNIMPKKPVYHELFANQLVNVGDRSKKGLLTKLA